jgi:DNA ligase-1
MILNKDLRMGMGVKTINKVFPGLIPTHDVMLAKLFERRRVKYPCFSSPKIDGVRGKFRKGVFYSRNGHPYKGLDHLSKELASITEELDGELIIPGITFQKSSGLIRNDFSTPNAEFHIFEIPTVKNNFMERLTMMDYIHLIGDRVKKVPHKLIHSEDELYEHYSLCRRFNFEGTVVKPYDYEYKGTRSYNWMKMKPKDNMDVKVIDIYEGKGKYKDQMGGVTVDFNNGNNVGGGWSDRQRKDYWEDPSLIIGKCIEVSFMELTDDGNFRHANFECIRSDK